MLLCPAPRHTRSTVQLFPTPLAHKDVKATTIYTHVLNRTGRGARGFVDFL